MDSPNTGTAQVDGTFAAARALVLSIDDASDDLLEKARTRLIPIAQRHGLQAIILAPLDAITQIGRYFDGTPHWLMPRIATEDSLDNLLNQILDLAPGRSWRQDPTFPDPVFKQLSEEDRVLLKRAFCDCIEVRLSDLDDRLKAFQALATLRDSRAGPHPLPFFVKLDRRPKIAREIENYRDCTTLFVPFYARPNLDWSRCLLGQDRGIIVANFVEHSSSLAEVVEQGAAQNAINSLFDDALRGWRRQAILPSAGLVTQPIAGSLGGARQNLDWALANERADAARKFGAISSPQDLARLLDRKPALQHRQALMHGDLHAKNVRVRLGHAILIDFAAVTTGPLVADPAALETALCLTAKAGQESIWRSCVEELYQLENLTRLPSARMPGADLSHLCDAVRQVRRFGISEAMSPNEYATAVAVFLFRHAFRKPLNNEPELRRSVLYALADKLARDL